LPAMPNNGMQRTARSAAANAECSAAQGKRSTMPRTITYSDPWRSDPRPWKGRKVKPGAGNAEPRRRGASPGSSPLKSPALKGRNRDCPRAAGKDKGAALLERNYSPNPLVLRRVAPSQCRRSASGVRGVKRLRRLRISGFRFRRVEKELDTGLRIGYKGGHGAAPLGFRRHLVDMHRLSLEG
jgi:hypothetical protein